MKITNCGLAILVMLTLGSAQDMESSCYGCHLELDDELLAPARDFADDIHARMGFGCQDCHGGDAAAWDMEESMSSAAGFTGVPQGREIIEICGRCHSDAALMRKYNPNVATDQESKYWTSGHGKSLLKGNTEVAQCVSCHDVHGIQKVDAPGSPVYHANVAETCGKCHASEERMAKYNFQADIVANYKRSVHGVALLERGDLAAPTCNNCHGNHGAAPPEVGSIKEVCGACHVNNQSLFKNTTMQKAFAKSGLHGCASCHTAHVIQHLTDDVITSAPGGLCAACHTLEDPGSLQADQIRKVLADLHANLTRATEAVDAAEKRGLEVQELLLELQNARTAQIQARTIVHTFDTLAVEKAAAPGMKTAATIVSEVQRIIADFRLRRIGLGIATILISFLAVVLYLYIRSIEK